MPSPDSKSFFRILYDHLGTLLAAGGLRGLVWWPLVAWLSLATPQEGALSPYGLKSLGFLLLALILDPWLAGGARALAREAVAGRPAGLGAFRRGLGRRYGARLAWTLLQAALAALFLFNLSLLVSPPGGLPPLLAGLAPLLTAWAWVIARAMHLRLPSLLDGGLPLGRSLAESFFAALARPWRHLYLLIFRFGMMLLVILSGIGMLFAWGSFFELHAECEEGACEPEVSES